MLKLTMNGGGTANLISVITVERDVFEKIIEHPKKVKGLEKDLGVKALAYEKDQCCFLEIGIMITEDCDIDHVTEELEQKSITFVSAINKLDKDEDESNPGLSKMPEHAKNIAKLLEGKNFIVIIKHDDDTGEMFGSMDKITANNCILSAIYDEMFKD